MVKYHEKGKIQPLDTCIIGKPCYDKRAAISARNKRWKDDRIRLRVYPCPICNKWHLTSTIRTCKCGKLLRPNKQKWCSDSCQRKYHDYPHKKQKHE